MATVLVVGGVGYIGSHMMKALAQAGHDAFAYDNLSSGYREAVLYGHLIEGCLSDVDFLQSVLRDYRQAYGFASTSLRYFNAAGADPDGELGERHEPETHLIPLVIRAAMGLQSKISVFGQDYDTPDGTCVRDYVHVTDLCDAHLLALNHLLEGDMGRSYNLGNCAGFSVSQVIDAVKRISGQEFSTEIAARRPGDPAVLVADATLATSELGGRPSFLSLTMLFPLRGIFMPDVDDLG